MRVPGRASAWLERHCGAGGRRSRKCAEQWINTDTAGEILRRPLDDAWLAARAITISFAALAGSVLAPASANADAATVSDKTVAAIIFISSL
jgi:hypothetical protein